ncbi:MAG: hypothetical protein EOP85_23190, partial [Verrucomicrobiaceae bacterium]
MAPLLIVGADERLREYLAKCLEGAWEYVFAEGAEEALELARKSRPAVILMTEDPESGAGVPGLHILQGDAVLRGVPVILLTSEWGEGERPDVRTAGADEY